MEWKDISVNPLLINNYSLLKNMGILDYIENLRISNKELDDLIIEAYNIFTKRSVDELIAYMIECLSDKFIPSNLVIILNEGIMVNKLKTIAFKNLKSTHLDLELESLEEYANFFRKNSGTLSFGLFEYEMDEKLLVPFKDLDTEIIIPINGHSGLYGLILFGSKILDEEYTISEIAYIDRLMKFISVGIQNNIHYEHSVKDSKTGLYNHNFFIMRLKEEISRSLREKSPCAIIIMDIDKFKNFNDTYGHLAGDEVIIQIAKTLKHQLRDMDILSRFGGEEFTILLPNTKTSTAIMVAERIRDAVESMVVEYLEHKLKVTISLGISIFNWIEDLEANDILNRADEALYESKNNGRNRITVFRSGLLHRVKNLNI